MPREDRWIDTNQEKCWLERGRASRPRNSTYKGSVVGKSGLVPLRNEACVTQSHKELQEAGIRLKKG